MINQCTLPMQNTNTGISGNKTRAVKLKFAVIRAEPCDKYMLRQSYKLLKWMNFKYNIYLQEKNREITE